MKAPLTLTGFLGKRIQKHLKKKQVFFSSLLACVFGLAYFRNVIFSTKPEMKVAFQTYFHYFNSWFRFRKACTKGLLFLCTHWIKDDIIVQYRLLSRHVQILITQFTFFNYF